MVIGMRVPMDLILERLEYVSPENHLKESHLHRWIKGMKLLPPDCVDLPEEYLYVTDRCYEIPDSCEASIVIIDPEGAKQVRSVPADAARRAFHSPKG